MSKYLTVKAWRAANPVKYREYQRAYMAKRRGSKPARASSSSITAEAPGVPSPVVAEAAPVVVTAAELAARSAGRIAALVARVPAADVANTEDESGPADVANTGPYFGITRRAWLKLGPDRQPAWLRTHGLVFDESSFAEWLEAMPTK